MFDDLENEINKKETGVTPSPDYVSSVAKSKPIQNTGKVPSEAGKEIPVQAPPADFESRINDLISRGKGKGGFGKYAIISAVVVLVVVSLYLGAIFITGKTDKLFHPVEFIAGAFKDDVDEGPASEVVGEPEESQGGSQEEPEVLQCPEDIMTCSDGSEVSRIPPDCNFESCPAPPCASEGESFIQSEEKGKQCCSSLSPIPTKEASENCGPTLPGLITCAMCGNGECGVGENICNCEDDCPKPREYPLVLGLGSLDKLESGWLRYSTGGYHIDFPEFTDLGDYVGVTEAGDISYIVGNSSPWKAEVDLRMEQFNDDGEINDVHSVPFSIRVYIVSDMQEAKNIITDILGHSCDGYSAQITDQQGVYLIQVVRNSECGYQGNYQIHYYPQMQKMAIWNAGNSSSFKDKSGVIQDSNINQSFRFDGAASCSEAVCNEDYDADSDNLSDLEEIMYFTDIFNSDTDGDSFLDGDEVSAGYNPRGSGKLE